MDITDIQPAEESLKKSEEKYRTLINGMRDTVWVIDYAGNFIDVNKAAVEVLGYSRKELLSMGPTDIDLNLDVETIKNLIKNILSFNVRKVSKMTGREETTTARRFRSQDLRIQTGQ